MNINFGIDDVKEKLEQGKEAINAISENLEQALKKRDKYKARLSLHTPDNILFTLYYTLSLGFLEPLKGTNDCYFSFSF